MAKHPIKRRQRTPARTVVTPRTTKSIYVMPSVKTDRAVGASSAGEHILAVLNEVCPTVVSFFEQPEKLKWIDKSGKRHTHTPDLESIRLNGTKYLYEVKPAEDVEEFEERTEIVTANCAAKGIVYMVRETEELMLEPRRSNALALANSCNPWVRSDEHLPMAVLLAFDQRSPQTLGELYDAVENFVTDPDELLQLAATGRFCIEIVSRPLGRDSRVSADPIFPCSDKLVVMDAEP